MGMLWFDDVREGAIEVERSVVFGWVVDLKGGM